MMSLAAFTGLGFDMTPAIQRAEMLTVRYGGEFFEPMERRLATVEEMVVWSGYALQVRLGREIRGR